MRSAIEIANAQSEVFYSSSEQCKFTANSMLIKVGKSREPNTVFANSKILNI